jgi:hypothetical protein
MLDKHIQDDTSALHKHLTALRAAVASNRIQPNHKNPSPFVFLCGANKGNGGISARRAALERFLHKDNQGTRAIIAERFIAFLDKNQKIQNLYDIEHTISNFADVIVIVLESNSAFTELGAFATKELRKKLFIVNDEQFKSAPSFINQGPIKAIDEESQDAVAWYQMSPAGAEEGDGIGVIFPALKKAIQKRLPKNEVLNSDRLKPSGELNRWAFSFVHDIIFSARKITTSELVSVYTFLYGKSNFDALSTYNALLNALGFIDKSGEYLKSTQIAPMLRLPINRVALQASFIAARHHLERSRA